MLRKLSFLTAMVAAMIAGSSARADVFFSGTFNVNGSVANSDLGPAGSNRVNASGLTLSGGGISYNNVYGTGVGGTAVNGNTIVTVGVVPLSSAVIASGTGGTLSLNTSNNLVAVYALRGTVTSAPPNAAANFQVEGGAAGAIWIMNRSNLQNGADNVFNNGDDVNFIPDNPTTWVNNLANLADGNVAKLSLNNLPTQFPFYDPGLQGTPTVTDPPVLNPAAINTANTAFNASANSFPEFKLQITDQGTLFSNAQVAPPASFGPYVQNDFALYLLLNQQVPSLQPGEGGTPVANVAALNQIAQQLLGMNFAATSIGGGTNAELGAVFTPSLVNGSGDIALTNTGGSAIFGGQFTQSITEVPEPASLIVWSVIAAGAGVGMVRRRRQAA